MLLFKICVLISLFYCVTAKNSNVKSLSESMGQEVIEIGPQIKDLPPDLEEEPSAEVDDDDNITTNQPLTTKKETKKTTTELRRKSKDVDVVDEEDSKIEKELAEIYKDDYKDNLDQGDKENGTMKPIARARANTNFKFQPDLNNPKEVERFRTSIDELSCEKTVTKKLSLENSKDDGNYIKGPKPVPDSSLRLSVNFVLCVSALIISAY